MKIALAALFCFIGFTLNAQHYNFNSYSVSDGLAQSQVRDICQDQYGYLWVGTASGLSRFNGIEFINYSIDDGLPDNNINSLYLGNNGDLWVSTAGGVALFQDQKIQSFNFETEYRINEIAELNGQIYFASNTGLVKLVNGEFIRLGSDETEQNYYLRSIVNYKDSILICGSKTGLYSWDGNVFESFNIPIDKELNIRSLTIQGDKLYVTARQVGLFSYDIKAKECVGYSLNYTTASELDFYQDKMYGISTNAGAFMIDQRDTLYFDDSNGLMGSGLDCIFIDSEGNVWIGTDGRGLLKFSGTAVVSYTTTDGLGSDLILSIEQDGRDNFIFGSYDAGITQFRSTGNNSFNVRNSGLVDNTVWCIMQDNAKSETWLGTSRGVTVLDHNNNIVRNQLYGITQKIRTIIQINQDLILIGGDEGLMVLKDDTLYAAAIDLNINKLHQVGDQVFCASSMGLYVFDIAGDYNVYEKIDLAENKIFTITSDRRNNLWIGTENGLFIRFTNGKVIRFLLDERDYRSKNILGLITSRDGSIWVSGMKGVYQIAATPDSEPNYQILNYGSAEGLINEESNINALYEDNHNNIWVGTASGLARINPKLNSELFAYQRPLLHITGIRLFMEEFDYKDYPVLLDSVFDVPTSIELAYNENHITFDFIGINLKDPRSVLYEYRLLGADEQWSPLSRSNYATYSFLQPGTYTFQVRSMNKNKNWSEVRELELTITAPFWKTWWFIFFVSLGVILIIWYFFKSRIRTIKQLQDNEKLELKNRLLFLEQRSLNASMNRHFIFNSLNSIQYFINSSDKLSANKYLSNFAKLIRKNLDSSAVNNFIVTLQEEIERIELYLSLEKMRFSEKFDYEINIAPSLDTESIEIT